MKKTNRPSSYAKRTYIQKAASINRRLRQGDITRIAEVTGYSTTHVSDVLAGKQFNDRIINKSFDLTRGRVSNPSKLASYSA